MIRGLTPPPPIGFVWRASCLAVILAMLAGCTAHPTPVSKQASPERVPSVSSNSTPSAPGSTPSTPSSHTPTPGPAELTFVEDIQPASYQLAFNPETLTTTTYRAAPNDAGPFLVATSARISPSQTAGHLTTYPLSLGTKDLVRGPGDSLWFADTTQAPEFGRLAVDGSVTQYSLPDFGPGLGAFVAAMTFGPSGDLWLVVTKWSTSSGPLTTYLGHLTPEGTFSLADVHGRPEFIALSKDGSVWLADIEASQLARVAQNTEQVFRLPDRTWPSYVAGGRDDAVWFMTQPGIGRLTADGNYSKVSIPANAWTRNGFVGGGSATGGLAFAADGTFWISVTQCRGQVQGVEAPGCEGLSRGDLEHWTETGQLLESLTLDLELNRLAVSDDGSIWFWGLRWSLPGIWTQMLGDYSGGVARFYSYPGFGVSPNPVVPIGGEVWYSAFGYAYRFSP